MTIHATITGRLGRDPELKRTDKGTAMLRFSLASDHGWGDRKSTTWVGCTLFGRRAESMERILTKGAYIPGRGAGYTTENDDGKVWVNCNVDDVDLPPRSVNEGQRQGASSNYQPGSGGYGRDEAKGQQGGDDDIPF